MTTAIVVAVIAAVILLIAIPGFMGLWRLFTGGHWKTAPFNAFTGKWTDGRGGPPLGDDETPEPPS